MIQPTADRSQLRDITGVEPLDVVVQNGIPYWIWAIAGAVAIGLVLAFLWARRRGMRAKAPNEWAIAELERLRASPTSPRTSLEAAEIVRRFVELRFAIPATRRTTQEFLKALAEDARIPRAGQNGLRLLLESCDRAKFARWAGESQEGAKAINLVEDFVRVTAQ